MKSLVIVLILALPTLSFAKDDVLKKKKHNHTLVELCSQECPGASTDIEVGSCIATKKSEPEFKPTSCSIAVDKKRK